MRTAATRWVALALPLLLGRLAVAQPEPTVSPPTAEVAAPKKEKKGKRPRVYGFVQVFYRETFHTGDDPQVDYDNFRVQRVRVGVKGKVIRKVRYVVEIDPRAPTITGIMRDAYIALRHIPRHEIRLGQQKTQFGYENRESSSELFAVNRTEISDNLARGPNLRDVGLGLVGKIPVGGGFRIDDAVTVTNGNGSNTQIDDTDMKSVWGRLGGRFKREELTIWLGGSFGVGDFVDPGDIELDPTDDFTVKFRSIGTDLEVDHTFAFLSAEYVWGRQEFEGETIEPKGYYVNLLGKAPFDLGPIVRYDELLIPEEDFRRWTFGAYWGRPDAPLRLLVNYEYRREKDSSRGDDRLYLWTQVRF
jgi:hypothetical protein